MFQKVKKVHFVGIGGIGMSGIAELLINIGFTVSGSDLMESPIVERLERMGAKFIWGMLQRISTIVMSLFTPVQLNRTMLN